MTRPTTRRDEDLRGPERFSLPVLEQPRPTAGRAAGAALALLALLVGVPVLLWVLTGPPPIPTSLPSASDLSDPLGVEAIFAVLRGVVWLAWLQFAVCTVVETIAIVEDRGLPRPVPLAGPSQALARALVSSLLIGASVVGSTSAANAAPSVETASTTASAVAASDAAGSGHNGTDATGRIADTSGSVAERGTAGEVDDTATRAPSPRMEHVAGVPATMTDVIGRKIAIVKPPDGGYHDNLWDIAERHLGDGRRWKEIHELNKGRTQPDGQHLVLGRLIQPGWVMIMPEDARGVVRVKEAPAPVAPASQTPEPSAPDQAPEPVGQQLPGGLLGALGLGGLVGATLLAGLLTERRRRRGGLLDDDEVETEVALRVGAEPGRAERLDAALRSLAAECRDSGRPLPQVHAATIGDDSLDLHLAPPLSTAPGRWSVHEDGARWRLDADEALHPSSGATPFPALVVLGRDDEGRDVLLDLEALGGVLSLEGSESVSREVASALAVQLAHLPWVQDHTVHTHALTPALAAVAGEALVAVEDVDSLVEEWVAMPRGARSTALLSGRARAGGGAPSHHLVLGAPLSAGTAARLGEIATHARDGVAVVSAVPFPEARWSVRVDEAGRLQVPLLDIEVQAVRVADHHADELAALFERARDEVGGTSDRVPVPRPPRADDDARWSTASVRVGVLGDLVLQAPGQLDPARVELATEVVVFVALQATPVHPSVVAASVWPGGVTPEVRDATLARVRDWLGTDAAGNHLLREDAEGRLSLAPGAVVDFYAFCSLVQRARAAAPEQEQELLRRALQLVRGEFLGNRPSRRYGWLPRTRVEQVATDLVVDSVTRLVDLSLPSDPGGAAAGCRVGLRMAPTSQEIWRSLLLAESHRPDGPSAVSGAVREMKAALSAADVRWDSETSALVDELLPGNPGREETA